MFLKAVLRNCLEVSKNKFSIEMGKQKSFFFFFLTKIFIAFGVLAPQLLVLILTDTQHTNNQVKSAKGTCASTVSGRGWEQRSEKQLVLLL